MKRIFFLLILLKFRKCELKIDEVKLVGDKGVRRSYQPLRWASELKVNRPVTANFPFCKTIGFNF